MALDGNGTYNLPQPEYPAITDTVIASAAFNTIMADIASALSLAVFRDGQAAFTANQSMGGFKLTNLANGVSAQDATTVAQVFTSPTFSNMTANGTTFGINVTGAATITAATVNMSGSTAVSLPAATTGVTPASTDNSTKFATTAMVQQVALNAAVPVMAGHSGEFLTNNGTDASWTALTPFSFANLVTAG